MADVNTGGEGGGGKHHKKKRAKKLSTRIDMTPMVDLGFLLLTFFMLTTTFSKPKVIELTPPAKTDTTNFEKIQDSLAFTVILSGNNKVYYYRGRLIQNKDSNNINLTDLSDNGLRKLLLQRNYYVRELLNPLDSLQKRTHMADTTYDRLKDKIQGKMLAIFVIIKTDSLARYSNVVATLDDMNICDVGKYALVDVSKEEIDMIKDYNEKHNIK